MSNYPSFKMQLDDTIKLFDMNIKAKENNAKTDYEKGYLQALIDAKNYFCNVKACHDQLIDKPSY